jgi:RimJ/RimL family protein N-acetyltransferase
LAAKSGWRDIVSLQKPRFHRENGLGIHCAHLRSWMNATLRKFQEKDFDGVVAMYAAFEPKGEFQGLPPHTVWEIKRWIRAFMEADDAQFVIEVDGRIVGHAVLCVSAQKIDAELAIFIHQNYRGLGLGRKFLLGVLNFGCKTLELDRVWVSVQGSNARALRLFEGVGFKPIGLHDFLQWEIEMQRPSHCQNCKGEKCEIFGKTLPISVRLPPQKLVAA